MHLIWSSHSPIHCFNSNQLHFVFVNKTVATTFADRFQTAFAFIGHFIGYLNDHILSLTWQQNKAFFFCSSFFVSSTRHAELTIFFFFLIFETLNKEYRLKVDNIL